jgi:hypothetical protein
VRDNARVRDKGIRLGIKPRVRDTVRDKARVRVAPIVKAYSRLILVDGLGHVRVRVRIG